MVRNDGYVTMMTPEPKRQPAVSWPLLGASPKWMPRPKSMPVAPPFPPKGWTSSWLHPLPKTPPGKQATPKPPPPPPPPPRLFKRPSFPPPAKTPPPPKTPPRPEAASEAMPSSYPWTPESQQARQRSRSRRAAPVSAVLARGASDSAHDERSPPGQRWGRQKVLPVGLHHGSLWGGWQKWHGSLRRARGYGPPSAMQQAAHATWDSRQAAEDDASTAEEAVSEKPVTQESAGTGGEGHPQGRPEDEGRHLPFHRPLRVCLEAKVPHAESKAGFVGALRAPFAKVPGLSPLSWVLYGTQDDETSPGDENSQCGRHVFHGPTAWGRRRPKGSIGEHNPELAAATWGHVGHVDSSSSSSSRNASLTASGACERGRRSARGGFGCGPPPATKGAKAAGGMGKKCESGPALHVGGRTFWRVVLPRTD